jgi:uncharacterized membrane protein
MEFLYQILNEIGFHHPLHPPLTHMPIGLIIGAFILFCADPLFRSGKLRDAAHYCMIMALIFFFPAAFLGFTDWQQFYAGTWSFPIRIKIILTGALAISITVGIVIELKKTGGFIGKFISYFLSVVIVISLGYFGGALVFPDKVSSASDLFPEGEKIYALNCTSCHPNGENVINPKLPIIGSQKMKDLDTFVKFNRKPLKSDGSKGIMPPYEKKKISEQEMKQLYQYLKSVAQQKTIP